jgi:hypothetical protein
MSIPLKISRARSGIAFIARGVILSARAEDVVFNETLAH